MLRKVSGITRRLLTAGSIAMWSPLVSDGDTITSTFDDKGDDNESAGGIQRRRASVCNIRPLGVLLHIISVVGRVRTIGGKTVQPHSNKMCLLEGGMPPLRPRVSKALAQLRSTKNFRTAAKTSLMAVRISLSSKLCSVTVMKRLLKKAFTYPKTLTPSGCSNHVNCAGSNTNQKPYAPILYKERTVMCPPKASAKKMTW